MTSAVGVLGFTVKAFATPDRFSANSTKVEFHLQKTEKFQIKNSDIFIFLLKTLIVGTR